MELHEIALIGVVFAVLVAIANFVFMACFNHIAPAFGFSELDYLQAFCLWVVFGFIFRSNVTVKKGD